MPVTLLCPRLTCRAMLRVPDHARGKRVRCAECGITLYVPKVGESQRGQSQRQERKPKGEKSSK